MRVLLTTDTVGGVWTFTRELTAGLLAQGHATALVSFGRMPSCAQRCWALETEEQYGSAFRYEALGVPLEWMERNHAAYFDAESLLLRVADEFEAEIIHTNQFCFGALPVEVPKVVTAHSDVLSWAEACRPDGIEDSGWLRQYKRLVSAGISGADLIATPTHWMRDALARNFPTPAEVRVILNGRSLAADCKGEPRRLQAVTVGRVWDEAKGLAVLDEFEICMPMRVVGEAHFEDERAPALKTVKFLGKLEEDEVLRNLRRSSVYLATSIYEPFGLAPLEAALCGCGVVARDIASLREVWGDAAIYFKDGNRLSDVMLRLRDVPEELEALRMRSMARALELSADRMVEAYIALYEQLLIVKSTHEEAVAYAD
ncbi:glycosyltransferase family 4 protein [Granulicella arctica]|uniref:glycosyltransferase family 4 protein n=1 Tax=Granulicella arctica TaxID=940613 RepID=UPI0021DFA927|nr:glycosyltransferase family 4 protein [Granulicella arctica]